jgi:hypothetical protein
MTLEVATATRAVDPARWIDPAVLAKCGISLEEAEAFKAPAPFAGDSPVPQPPYDPAKPHMAYPNADMYRAMIAAPDEAIAKAASYAEPPVPA